jgi:hypothetical protein
MEISKEEEEWQFYNNSLFLVYYTYIFFDQDNYHAIKNQWMELIFLSASYWKILVTSWGKNYKICDSQNLAIQYAIRNLIFK